MFGRVKFYEEDRKYGEILAADGKTYAFYKHPGLPSDIKGKDVNFTPSQETVLGKPKAEDIQVIE